MVVLVHGLVISSRYVEPLARALADNGYRVLAPDLPGYGESATGTPRRVLSVEQLADVLDLWLSACAIDKATFIGDSFQLPDCSRPWPCATRAGGAPGAAGRLDRQRAACCPALACRRDRRRERQRSSAVAACRPPRPASGRVLGQRRSTCAPASACHRSCRGGYPLQGAAALLFT